MFASLTRWMTSVLETLEAPRDGAKPDLGRRAFTRMILLVAFSGTVRPLSARTRANRFCSCDGLGQCTDPCSKNPGHCDQYRGLGPTPPESNCWCVPAGDSFELVCDCTCPGYNCTCATMHSATCTGGGGGKFRPGEVPELF